MCMCSDVYAFGIGEQVNKEQLNALASQKSGETHVFFLKDYDALGEVFNSIISKDGSGPVPTLFGFLLLYSLTPLLKATGA